MTTVRFVTYKCYMEKISSNKVQQSIVRLTFGGCSHKFVDYALDMLTATFLHSSRPTVVTVVSERQARLEYNP